MKAYQAEFYKTYGYGAYDEFKYVVFAENETAALGLALEAEEGTDAKHWEIEELASDTQTAHCISRSA